ncbi:uncharacterized protein TNCV_3897821 [Trichonephila clavipes]|nr:uncharacterized protein TNCV_3897821 [Trichonephila clavipes]
MAEVIDVKKEHKSVKFLKNIARSNKFLYNKEETYKTGNRNILFKLSKPLSVDASERQYFYKKSLIIPDDQIKSLPIVEKPAEIDISNTKVDERQKEELQDLFNSFKGLFSDQPGLTHVLYHEIDPGDQGPVVSRPYRYDRVKQGIINYLNQEILKEGTIWPIQSPYASPVV